MVIADSFSVICIQNMRSSKKSIYFDPLFDTIQTAQKQHTGCMIIYSVHSFETDTHVIYKMKNMCKKEAHQVSL